MTFLLYKKHSWLGIRSVKKSVKLKSSVADPGCLSRIPDPKIFFHPESRTKIRIKNFLIFLPKKLFSKVLKLFIRFGYPIRILNFYPSRIPYPGSRGQQGTGSRIRIRNTAQLASPIKSVMTSAPRRRFRFFFVFAKLL